MQEKEEEEEEGKEGESSLFLIPQYALFISLCLALALPLDFLCLSLQVDGWLEWLFPVQVEFVPVVVATVLDDELVIIVVLLLIVLLVVVVQRSSLLWKQCLMN